MAARQRRETTLTLEWIAGHLWMGAPTHVAALLQPYNRKVELSRDYSELNRRKQRKRRFFKDPFSTWSTNGASSSSEPVGVWRT
jgi:hypothetical protein